MKVFLKIAYIYILLSRDALKSFSSMVQDIPGFVKSHLTKIIFEKFPCTSHQWECLRSKNLQAINAGEGVEKREPPTLLVGMQTSTATMENSVEIP